MEVRQPMNNYIPGTIIPSDKSQMRPFSLLSPMISAADGLSLSQVCAITGLEPSTIQNWVKRNFVPHTIKKKYYARHVARILIISMMRDSMSIDDIGKLLGMNNGVTDDEKDELISEQDLYDCVCEVIYKTADSSYEKALRDTIKETISQYNLKYYSDAEQRLTLALLVMLNAYHSCTLKKNAELYFNQLKERTR